MAEEKPKEKEFKLKLLELKLERLELKLERVEAKEKFLNTASDNTIIMAHNAGLLK